MKYLLLLLAVMQYGFAAPPKTALSSQQWKDDINFFAKQLQKKHKNLFHTTTKETFDRSISDLKNLAGTIPDYEVIIKIQQIAASIGDGHTVVHLPPTFKRLPVVLFWFNKDLYVSRTTNHYKNELGKRVIRIGDHSMDEVMKKISTVMSVAENEWFNMSSSAQYMVLPEVLATLKIIPSVEKVSLTLMDDNNNENTIELTPIPQDGKAVWISVVKEEPLFRQRINENFWFRFLPDINAVYVNWKNYDDLGKNVNELFDFIKEKNVSRLIVDMRQNGGGDFKKGRRHFIDAVQKHPAINQKGNLYVITGRRTFSAAMVNSIDFKKQTAAIILGEPPGERPNSYSENDEMKLPNSGLVISYSTKYYQFLDDDVPAFMPDIRVDPNWNDFKRGVDPVMEKIKSIL